MARLVVNNKEGETFNPVQRKKQMALDLMKSDLMQALMQSDQRLGCDGDLWYLYQNGYWRVLSGEALNNVNSLIRILCARHNLSYSDSASAVQREISWSEAFMMTSKEFDKYPYLVFRNGTLDVRTGELVAHSPEHMTTRVIDVEYDADADCPTWQQMLGDMFDDLEPEDRAKVVACIQDWFGVALLGTALADLPRALRKALYLYGPAYTGKSTILNVLRGVIGSQNVVSVGVEELERHFGLETFLEAQAWITEEVTSGDKPTGTARLKALITGESLSVPRRYKTNKELTFTGPVAWASNTPPNFTESSSALYERLLVIPVERTFTEAEARARFGTQLPWDYLANIGEYPGIVQWALVGYKRAIARGSFDITSGLKAANSALREQNDPLYSFLKDCCVEDPNYSVPTASIAYACAVYTKRMTGSYPRIKPLQSALRNAVPNVYRDVQTGRRSAGSGSAPTRHVWRGLRLNEHGLRLWETAKGEFEAAADLTVNDRLLGG